MAAEGSPGGTALLLVGALIAQLRARGLISGEELGRGLLHIALNPVSEEQRADAENAAAMIAGMVERLPD